MGSRPSINNQGNNNLQNGLVKQNTINQQPTWSNYNGNYEQNKQNDIHSQLYNSILEKLDAQQQTFLQQVNNEQMQLQNENQQLKQQNSQCYQYIQRLEQEKSNFINQGTDQALASQYLFADRKVKLLESDLTRSISDLTRCKDQYQKVEEDFLKTKQELTLKERDYESLLKENEKLKTKINKYKENFFQQKESAQNINEQTISKLKEEIKKYKEQLNQIAQNNQNYINEIDQLRQQINAQDNICRQFYQIQNEIPQQEQLVHDQKLEIIKLKLSIENLESNVRDLNRKLQEKDEIRDKDLKEAKRELDKKNEELITENRKRLEQEVLFEQQTQTLKQDNLKEQQKLKETFEEYKNKQYNDHSASIQTSTDKLTSIRSRLQMIFARKSYEEQKIQNLIEESSKKLQPLLLSEFEKYENGNINEIEVEIFEVDWDQNFVSQIIENKNNFYELYRTLNINHFSLGKYKGILTISSMGENEFQQIKLFKVVDDNQNNVKLKNSVFGLIQNKTMDSNLINIKRAAQLVMNSAICDYYLKKFIKVCKDKHLVPNQIFSIGKQYIIKLNDNFFQAEILSNSTLVEYLGGPIQIINDFMAAFSYFTYIQSNNELLISYLASIGNIIYNPYICTRDGILTQVDLGVTEINNISEKIEKNKTLLGSYIALFNI